MELIIFFIALTINIVLSKYSQKFFLNKNFVDKINERSSHIAIATRSGGLSMFLIIFFYSIYFYLIGNEIFDFSILIPISILFIIGFYDDLYKVDFKLKFIFQIIAAKILIDYGYVIDNFHGILGIDDLNRIFAQVFTIFIIVAIINAINFIDGIDGLASSIVGIFIILYEFFSKNTSEMRILSFIILGLLISFLFFNLKKDKKVFLGDSGSLFLGGIVSVYVLDILSSNYLIKEEFDLNKILFVISILAYPIIDIIRIFFLRIIKNKSPFIADKQHIHHLLHTKFKSHKKTTLFIAFLSTLFMILIQIIF
jgi:UDP-N-acetylmuramyl pentapeptide phosphotransferase/UDP-N-acetylglucosamine-1-phosphate transferase